MEGVTAEDLMSPPYDGSIANLMDLAVDNVPEQTAFEHLGNTITFEEFSDRVHRIAGGLHEMGIGPDDRVGIYLPNGIPFCTSIWACIHAGVVASPLNPEYRRREIEYQLDHSDSKAVITDGEGEEFAAPVAEELGIEVISSDPDSEYTTLDELAESGEPTRVERSDDDVIMQPYTSGTTGKPKGVLLVHKNFRVKLVRSLTQPSAPGESLVVLPMYHITGLSGMLARVCNGRTTHLLRPDHWDPELVLEKISEYPIPAFTGVATMIVDIVETYKENEDKYDLSTLQRVGQGGAKLPEPVHEEFEELFDVPIGEGYGLTETTAGTHGLASLGDRVGSVGQPIPFTHSKIIDEEGNEVPDGEPGELVVKGPHVMKGYYNNPDANEEAFTDEGYFRTGDIARRDEDNYYYIEGREKDMILTGGYNVYPSEVEQTLYDHPEIQEAAVFGIPHERKGETVAAAVSLTESGTLNEEEIKEYVLQELAPYKHPRIVEIHDQLPKTGSGKIRKVELREEYLDEAAA